MAEPIVDARAIHKHFGALHVLKGVDLKVAERELVFVIGPSGSGKSTLLRCLNRLEEPSSGSVVVDGIDMLSPRTDINHARQRIGMVFQSFNLFPHLTAKGNVMLAQQKVLKRSKAEAEKAALACLRARPTLRPAGLEPARGLPRRPALRQCPATAAPETPTPGPTFTPAPPAIGSDWVNGCISVLWKPYPATIQTTERNGCLLEPVNLFFAADGRLTFFVSGKFDNDQVYGMFAPLPAGRWWTAGASGWRASATGSSIWAPPSRTDARDVHRCTRRFRENRPICPACKGSRRPRSGFGSWRRPAATAGVPPN